MSGPAFIFPGQGSQGVGMGQDLWRGFPEARAVFAAADEALGYRLSGLCFAGPAEELRQTEYAQPAILTVSIAAWRALAPRTSAVPAFVAGHSLGQYSALVAAEALSFPDAVRLVQRRGRLMAAAQPQGVGAMTAILGLTEEAVRGVVVQASPHGVVEIANLNSPGQVVIAGEIAAVTAAAGLASAAGAARIIPLPVSGAFHTSLMRPAAEAFAVALAETVLRPARIPLMDNVTARPVTEADEIGRLLVAQVYSPVRWEESVRAMAVAGTRVFIELGPGRILSSLVGRICREARTISVYDEPSLKKALAILGEV